MSSAAQCKPEPVTFDWNARWWYTTFAIGYKQTSETPRQPDFLCVKGGFKRVQDAVEYLVNIPGLEVETLRHGLTVVQFAGMGPRSGELCYVDSLKKGKS